MDRSAAQLIASLRELEAKFGNASETIRQIRPDEQIGSFPSLQDIETLGSGDLGIRECFAFGSRRSGKGSRRKPAPAMARRHAFPRCSACRAAWGGLPSFKPPVVGTENRY